MINHIYYGRRQQVTCCDDADHVIIGVIEGLLITRCGVAHDVICWSCWWWTGSHEHTPTVIDLFDHRQRRQEVRGRLLVVSVKIHPAQKNHRTRRMQCIFIVWNGSTSLSLDTFKTVAIQLYINMRHWNLRPRSLHTLTTCSSSCIKERDATRFVVIVSPHSAVRQACVGEV